MHVEWYIPQIKRDKIKNTSMVEAIKAQQGLGTNYTRYGNIFI